MKKQNGNDETKYRLADAVRECMKTTPVSEITVRQISEVSGITRQTFYRHFLDRDDLINWYFDSLLDESFRQMGSGDTIRDGLRKKFAFIRKEALFFTAAFQSDTQNNLKEHDYQMILAFYKNKIREKTGGDPEEEILDLLEMYCQASVFKTVQWVLGGMRKSERAMAEIMIDAMPQKLTILFTKLGFLQ